MSDAYTLPLEFKRRPWQRRLEVFSPKLRRRLTFFSRETLDAWVLLEADPKVHSFCERPAYIESTAGRMFDFWIDRGRHQNFWVVSPPENDIKSLTKIAHGIAVKTLQCADMVALSMRIQNWGRILPYRICALRFPDKRLQRDILARLEKPHRLERIEAAFQPLDVSSVRSALFELLAAGRVTAPDIDSVPLSLSTVFRRAAA